MPPAADAALRQFPADASHLRLGAWVAELAAADPASITIETPCGPFEMTGEVLNVEPGRLVEFTMDVPGQQAPDSTVRFEIAPDGPGRSRFTLVQSGITDEMVAGVQRRLDEIKKIMSTDLDRYYADGLDKERAEIEAKMESAGGRR